MVANKIDIIKISLRNLINEVDKYYDNAFDIRIVKTVFEIVSGIERLIIENSLNDEGLHAFQDKLPKFKHLDLSLIEKTFWEIISEYSLLFGSRNGQSIEDLKSYNEAMGFTYRSKKRERVRNEVSEIVFEIETRAKKALDYLVNTRVNCR
ncbi:hypothetical protein [Carboxylicivirga sp. N1Y90]|uniref:hypothetical protein n=1 Tax=Carboxylicivirga fragile TaxID=3417571 RepID=UPI003D336E75|nr:hypothetical protein [Marinilabiliaceae bacterium N1Y90]